MVIFILLTFSYILGMSVATVMEIKSAGFFFFLGGVSWLLAFLPFWSKNAPKIQDRDWKGIVEDEEWLPVLTILLALSGFFFIGIYKYSTELHAYGAGHIDRVMNVDDPYTKWRLVGRIIEEPNLKNDFLEVVVEPEMIQEIVKQPKRKGKGSSSGKSRKGKKKKGVPAVVDVPAVIASGTVASGSVAEPDPEPEIPPQPTIKVDGGCVLAQVFQDNDAFNRVKFNQKVEIIGKFSKPSARRNPGSLDFQRSLINRGIFRTARLTSERGSSFHILSEVGGGSVWYRFALFLRTEFLKVVKQTMPYPESSFLGGVLLGLKGGLPPIITTEFRMTGVSHVLAVSGLHVTIIAGLFYGLFTIFRVPLRVFAPIIVFFLFTFALIVGWPSSAVRAAMMNSLFVLSRAYLRDYGFKQSIIFALSFAAFYILTVSPLQLTEPSFTLSFMAIYALAMFSGPSEQLLRECLRGPGLAFAAIMTLLFYFTVMIKPGLIVYQYFFWFTGVYAVGVLWFSRKLSVKSGFQSYSFEMLPQWLASFTASQMGIFLGMMGPMSSFYFGSMSLSAPIANMIAIPLIGVIVQLGMIAGILGSFIPGIGMYLALLINAANWLAVKFFLGMAHFFAVVIPFPRVSQPGLGTILLYYLLLHLFFYWDTIKTYGMALVAAVEELWDEPDYRMPLGLTGGVLLGVLLYFGIFSLSRVQSVPPLRATLLDVGYGSSLLVEKGGKTLLIDAGMRDGLSGYDVGERVIQPAFSEKHVGKIDAVILTTFLPERISGLFKVMENYQVSTIYAPFPIPTDGRKLLFHEFLERVSLDDRKLEEEFKKNPLIPSPPNYYWEQAFAAYNSLIEAVRKHQPAVVLLRPDTKIDGFADEIQVLHPASPGERFSGYYDSAILLIKNSGKRIAYAGGNVKTWKGFFPETLDLLMLAELPYPLEAFEEFLTGEKPGAVAVSFRKPSGWLMDKYYLGKMIERNAMQLNKHMKNYYIPVYLTEKNGAIQADVRKERLSILPFMAPENSPEAAK